MPEPDIHLPEEVALWQRSEEVKVKVIITELSEEERQQLSVRRDRNSLQEVIVARWTIEPKRLQPEEVRELVDKLRKRVPELEDYEIFYMGSGSPRVPSLLGIRPKKQ